MQNIINSRDIIKQLSKSGLQIGDKTVLNYHIKNFNYNTFVYGYSDPFYIDKNNRRYDSEANSDEIIHLYKFDRDMANHILRYILVIEKIINTNVVNEAINHYGIQDKCLLKLNPGFIEHQILPNLRDVEPKTSYYNFIRKLVKYLPSSKPTKQYCQKNIYDEVMRWRNCPLDIMCLTWSFSTSFSFFIALEEHARVRILNNFELQESHYHGFIDFLKNTLHLRNFISHNNVIYNVGIPYQSASLLNLYEFVCHRHVQTIKLFEMMELIQFFSHSTTLVSNTRYYYGKIKIKEKFKKKINLFGEINND